MSRISSALTVLSVAAALTGLAYYAVAASCVASLPPSNAIPGWVAVTNATTSGEMGSQQSYNAYDGAVEAMQAEGIKSFAQRIYRHSATGKYLTLDIYYLSELSKAKALYDRKRNGYRQAKPLTDYTSIPQRACVGTLGTTSFGVLQRGAFVCEVTIARSSTAADRITAKAFLTFVSGKLGR